MKPGRLLESSWQSGWAPQGPAWMARWHGVTGMRSQAQAPSHSEAKLGDVGSALEPRGFG